MEGLQVAADAQERAMAAARQRAGLAGDIGAADWQRAATTAAAENALEQFNASFEARAAQLLTSYQAKPAKASKASAAS
jgi:hypothetical protein